MSDVVDGARLLFVEVDERVRGLLLAARQLHRFQLRRRRKNIAEVAQRADGLRHRPNGIHQAGDCGAVVDHLDGLDICCGISGEEATLTVDGIDPGSELKSSEVNAGVSTVSTIPDVRDVLVAKQREYLDVADIVMEGRDIGSVVFPETPYKFYIDAAVEIRARRRMAEGIEDNLAERDAVDSGRKTSPLVIAEDAVVIDTSEMTLEEVLMEVIDRLRKQGLDILD